MEIELGNTNNSAQSKKTRTNQLKKWFFTYNNYNLETLETNILPKIEEISEKYAIQEETGENGTPHLQGCILLKKSMRWEEFKLPKEIHWEKCKDWDDSVRYCTKKETRTGKQWTKGIPKPLKVIENLFDWQKDILDTVNQEPDDRSIFWYYDKEGNKGKTQLAKYICSKKKALFVSGKASDIKCAVAKWLEEMGELEVCIFGFPRSLEHFVSYEAIESIKDGIFFSGKYESGMCMFNSPHVLVFSNFAPDKTALSKDRWKIKEI